jgi:hypothetical protein
MAIFTMVFLPSLGGVFRFELRNAGRALASELGYAAERATSTGTPHLWVLDLEAQAFRVEEVRVSEPQPFGALPAHAELLDLRPPVHAYETVPVANRSGEWRYLDAQGVWIQEVRLGEEKFETGTVQIAFGPEGGGDPAEILLRDESGSRLRVLVVPFTGEIRVSDAEDV